MSLVKTIGVVVYRRTPKGPLFLLLHHRGPYWNFPKGRVEAGEAGKELMTAFRELREETAIPRDAVSLQPRFRATYRYRFRGHDALGKPELVTKLAVFYLGELTRDAPVAVSHEHLGFAWVDAEEAKVLLYYPGGKKILAAVVTCFSPRSPQVPAVSRSSSRSAVRRRGARRRLPSGHVADSAVPRYTARV
ncbi:MAG: NUDIX domain-containing protein [bacterium]|nr:NUDIX domain-containing protein [bacterium]